MCLRRSAFLIAVHAIGAALLSAAEPATPLIEGPCAAIASFVKQRNPAAREPEAFSRDLRFACRIPKDPNLRFVIATVPNPVGTHLALWFDRAVESIQNAASSVEYRFQEAWVPWDPDLIRDESDPTKRAQERRESQLKDAQPGVLLFRAPECMAARRDCVPQQDLVVLLVPEVPTGGIDQAVFADAATIADERAAPGDIRVLGPSFSGSFASLAKIITARKSHGDTRQLRVITGSASSSQGWRAAFSTQRERKCDTRGILAASTEDQSEFHTTVHNTRALWLMFGTQMQERMLGAASRGIPRPRIAILTESETGLGRTDVTDLDPNTESCDGNKSRGPESTLPEAVVIRYPREISRLRNAYGDQELKSVVGAQPQQPSFRNLLSFRLFDTRPAHDSTPVFATNQTPLSQDTVLMEIARTLENQNVSLAGILATDIFDSLFLARYLRDACPNVRLFTFDSDLLYVRAAEDFPLQGTLAVTTYPLVPANQDWTDLHQPRPGGHGPPERILFSSRAAEGIYNAMKALLVDADKAGDHGTASLVEYFDASAHCIAANSPSAPLDCQKPPLWLTVVGRGGYWPLSMINPGAIGSVAPPGESHDRLLPWKSQNTSRLRLEMVPRAWQFVFALLTGYLCFHFLKLVRASRPGARWKLGVAHLSLWPREQGWLSRFCYLWVCSLALLAIYAACVAPLLSAALHDRSSFGGLVWVVGGLFALFLAISLGHAVSAALAKRRNPSEGRDQGHSEDRWQYGLMIAGTLYTAALVAGLLDLFRAHRLSVPHEDTFFFAYRSLHLTSGVSPMVPFLILLPSFYLWARVHLKRVGTFYDRMPKLPSLGPDSLSEGLDLIRARMEALIRDPLPWHWLTAGAFFAILIVWYCLTSPLETFEYRPFKQLFLLAFSTVYALLFLTWIRFLLIWDKLRLFLTELERLPIRSAIQALPKLVSWSPILTSNAWEKTYRAQVHVRDCLPTLRPMCDLPLKQKMAEFEHWLTRTLLIVNRGCRVRQRQTIALGNRLLALDAEIIAGLNRSRWLPDAAGSVGATAESCIAHQFADYILGVMRQLRNLLFFLTAGFVLTILALHSYPFQSPRTITSFITIAFLLIASGVVKVLLEANVNTVLSWMTNTSPGKVDTGFFVHLATYLALPMLTVISSQFPSLGRFLFSWVEPILQAIR